MGADKAKVLAVEDLFLERLQARLGEDVWKYLDYLKQHAEKTVQAIEQRQIGNEEAMKNLRFTGRYLQELIGHYTSRAYARQSITPEQAQGVIQESIEIFFDLDQLIRERFEEQDPEFNVYEFTRGIQTGEDLEALVEEAIPEVVEPKTVKPEVLEPEVLEPKDVKEKDKPDHAPEIIDITSVAFDSEDEEPLEPEDMLELDDILEDENKVFDTETKAIANENLNPIYRFSLSLLREAMSTKMVQARHIDVYNIKKIPYGATQIYEATLNDWRSYFGSRRMSLSEEILEKAQEQEQARQELILKSEAAVKKAGLNLESRLMMSLRVAKPLGKISKKNRQQYLDRYDIEVDESLIVCTVRNKVKNWLTFFTEFGLEFSEELINIALAEQKLENILQTGKDKTMKKLAFPLSVLQTMLSRRYTTTFKARTANLPITGHGNRISRVYEAIEPVWKVVFLREGIELTREHIETSKKEAKRQAKENNNALPKNNVVPLNSNDYFHYTNATFRRRFPNAVDDYLELTNDGTLRESGDHILIKKDRFKEFEEKYSISSGLDETDNKNGYFVSSAEMLAILGITRPHQISQIVGKHSPYVISEDGKKHFLITPYLAAKVGIDFPPRIGKVKLDKNPGTRYTLEEKISLMDAEELFRGYLTATDVGHISSQLKCMRGQGNRVFVREEFYAAVEEKYPGVVEKAEYRRKKGSKAVNGD